eukprot:TRINITY_DN1918_c0_g1_i2.p1 TRINITY_DN1918_c0_g1~~TRINITY_DN1918_c0_g1_i2.p1  ORF type:complete len:316 (+),score=78.40 TRINITY_DN1918_c0_g1_i2:56-1003(+)
MSDNETIKIKENIFKNKECEKLNTVEEIKENNTFTDTEKNQEKDLEKKNDNNSGSDDNDNDNDNNDDDDDDDLEFFSLRPQTSLGLSQKKSTVCDIKSLKNNKSKNNYSLPRTNNKSKNKYKNGINNNKKNYNNNNNNNNNNGTLLHNKWTFWFNKRYNNSSTKNNFPSNLQEIGTMSTIEDFWCFFNHLLPPSRLSLNTSYYFFKNGIKPMWEDPENLNGGKWVFSLRNNFDKIWEDILIYLIGETICNSEKICGFEFSKRKNYDRFCLWLKQCNETYCKSIGKNIKNIIKNESISLQFSDHHSNSNKLFKYKI